MRVLVVCCCLTALAACHESATGPTVPLSADFVLAPGQSASVQSTDVTVRFDRVTNDSRCPADAFCIQGGDALVHITVGSSRGTREYDLHTGSLQPVRHEDLTIHLSQLAPYPFSSRTIAPDDYRATLRVTR